MSEKQFGILIVSGLLAVLCIIAVGMYGLPLYNVWRQGKEGEAELRRAEQNRQIAVQEAMAKHEAAKQLAHAEIERAKGVAEANRIIAEGLGGPQGYLHYLWLHALEATAGAGDKVVYVPTEANLPILEAGKR